MPALRASRRTPTSDETLALMRGVVREGAQDRPGIYRMLSSDGEVVYVGKSKRVRTRLLEVIRGQPVVERHRRVHPLEERVLG